MRNPIPLDANEGHFRKPCKGEILRTSTIDGNAIKYQVYNIKKETIDESDFIDLLSRKILKA